MVGAEVVGDAYAVLRDGCARLVWTNDESEDAAITTVTFTEKSGKTLLVHHELYPTKQALDSSLQGMEGCMPEQFEQLDELLASLIVDA